MARTYNPSISKNGLILYYDFINPSSFDETTSTIKDISTNQQVTTKSSYIGKNNGVLGLRNFGDIYTNLQYSNPTEFTLCVWFRTNTASGKKLIGFESDQTGTSSVNGDRSLYVDTSGILRFGVASSSYSYGTSVTNNQWMYAVVTYNAGSIVLYLNGSSVGTASQTASSYSGYWRIGGYKLTGFTNGSDGYFTGDISSVKVYNRALTAAEVQQNYNSTKALRSSRSATFITGQQAYATPGTYSWIAPASVTAVSAVAVGAGGQGAGYCGGAGGGLGWKNNIAVTPGSSYTVVVGAISAYGAGGYGGDSYFISTSIVKGGGGQNSLSTNSPSGGSYTGDGGGNGGSCFYPSASYGGGAGAGGYSGNGGNGGAAVLNNTSTSTAGTSGSGGGGGGGSGARTGGGGYPGGTGGGVGILGQGSDGVAAASANSALNSQGKAGGAGSGGNVTSYGGGAGGGMDNAGAGAVRIIWGLGRLFPSTNTGDL